MSSPTISIFEYGRLVRGNRNFRKLWLAQIVSEIGDWFYTIAIFSLLLELTGKAQSVAIGLVLWVLPQTFIGPIAGAVNDRISRRKVMIFADLARVVIVGSHAVRPFRTKCVADLSADFSGNPDGRLLRAGAQFGDPQHHAGAGRHRRQYAGVNHMVVHPCDRISDRWSRGSHHGKASGVHHQRPVISGFSDVHKPDEVRRASHNASAAYLAPGIRLLADGRRFSLHRAEPADVGHGLSSRGDWDSRRIMGAVSGVRTASAAHPRHGSRRLCACWHEHTVDSAGRRLADRAAGRVSLGGHRAATTPPRSAVRVYDRRRRLHNAWECRPRYGWPQPSCCWRTAGTPSSGFSRLRCCS